MMHYIAIRIGEGFQEAHENEIVHRDIKSANIMFTSKEQVKITAQFCLYEISISLRILIRE